MNSHCEKLSPLTPMINNQDLKTYLNGLYPVYLKEIAEQNFTFHDKPVHVFTDLNYNLQHQTFEHLTTKGSNDRLYNTQRCERLLWIRDILGKVCNDCSNYRVFRDMKWKSSKGNFRYILWCVEEDYVIVLEERDKIVLLITAYCVIYSNKRKDLEILYQKSLNNKNAGN